MISRGGCPIRRISLTLCVFLMGLTAGQVQGDTAGRLQGDNAGQVQGDTAGRLQGDSHNSGPDTLSLYQDSTTSGLGHPFPTALADPLQSLYSWIGFPPIVPPPLSEGTSPLVAEGTPPLAHLSSSSDDRIWTLRIEPGSRWGEGKPLRASGIRSSLEGLVSTRTRSPYAVFFRHVLGFEDFRNGTTSRLDGVVVIDSLTVQILLTESDPDMPRRLAHPAAGMVLWPRRNPHRPARGPLAWIPEYGRPTPQGLRPVEWVSLLRTPGAKLASMLKTKGPRELTLALYPSPRLSGTAITSSDLPMLLTGPVLPDYCPGSRTESTVLAESYSLVILVMRPSIQEEEEEELYHKGLSWDQRLTIAKHLAARRDLLPYAEGFVPAEGFLDNPPGYFQSILMDNTLEGIFGLRKDEEIRLFYRSGDMAHRCVAKRIVALLSELQPVRSFGVPKNSIRASLRTGDFDMVLVSVPSMAWTHWERAAVMLGFLNGHLWEPMQPRGMEDWMGLPVDPVEAETRARRFEGPILEDAILVPVGWMKSRLLLEPEVVDVHPGVELPWPLPSLFSLLGADLHPQAPPPDGR